MQSRRCLPKRDKEQSDRANDKKEETYDICGYSKPLKLLLIVGAGSSAVVCDKHKLLPCMILPTKKLCIARKKTYPCL